VTDETGASATGTVDVRAAGQTAPTARIVADVTAGAAPLNVRFDGTTSSAPDDSITDYSWDFNDGTTSRLSAPFHSFSQPGVYEVELRVATGGGLEGTTTQRIEVGGLGASLQFDASQRITLPVAAAVALNQFTFEAWYKADNGGEVVSMGGAFRLEIEPDDDVVRVTVNGSTQEASVNLNTGAWEHVAIVYDIADGAEVFIGGQSFGTLTFDEAIVTDTLIAGRGWRGKLSELRTWTSARTQAEISANLSRRLSGAEAGLFSNWPLNEGSGQLLANRALGGLTGALGSATAEEAADPAWSNDGPPLP
jgi:PKD repeat protein